MAVTASPWTTRRDLLWAPRKLAAIQFPYTSAVITILHNPTTGALVLPENGYVIGLHAKQAGGRLANAQTINDIRSHGIGGPTRQIPSQRDITLGLEPQETNRINLENFWGADWSGVVPDASGGVTLPVPELPINRLNRIVLLGKDDWNGLPIYIAWLLNRVNISETTEQQMTDPEVATYPYVMNAQGEDELLGQPAILDIFGAGWQAIQERAEAGFYPAVTSLSISPATATLTVALGASHTQQLTVTDSNNNDRTDTVGFASSDPTKVSVSPTGLMTGVGVTSPAANEVQSVTVTGTPTAGTFTLTFKGQTTAAIAYNAAAAAVQSALVALSTIGAGNAAVTGTGPYTVTFQGTLAQTDVPQMTGSGALLTGGTSPAVAVATTTPGVAPVKVTATGSGLTAVCSPITVT